MSASVQLAVVGCGAAGRRYVSGIRAVPGWPPVLLSDPAPTRARSLALEIDSLDVELERLHELPGVRGVVIATPAGRRADDAAMALASGRHVLVDAPFGTDSHSLRALHEDAGARGLHLAVGYPLRFAPLVRAARRLLPAPVIAQGHFRASWMSEAERSETAGLPRELPAYAVAGLDLLCHCMRAAPDRVFAESAPGRSQTPDGSRSVAAMLMFPGGRAATLTIGPAEPPPPFADPYLEFSDGRRRITMLDGLRCAELHGFSTGDIAAAAQVAGVEVDSRDGAVRLRAAAELECPGAWAHRDQARAFVRLVAGGDWDVDLGSVTDERRCMVVLHALGGAMLSGQPRAVRAV